MASFTEWLFARLVMPLVEANLVPDVVVRWGVRRHLRALLRAQGARSLSQRAADKAAYVADLKTRPLAEHTRAANDQHYEVPARFFDLVMGQHKKYSCGLWEGASAGAGARAGGLSAALDETEAAALRLVCQRAQLEDVAGLRVLDMGCGWGSFSLFAAARFPRASFVAVSNSASQRAYIEAQCTARGIANLSVVTCDINVFDGAGGGFDRVVSIEMMEHVKNYELLLRRVASWMRPGALFFVHIFTHREVPFHYTDGWMAQTFFSGGQMPSDDLLLYFQRDVQIVDHWVVQGSHYERTCNAWLQRFDGNRAEALDVLRTVYGADTALLWLVNWRLFFIMCAELFGFDSGNEWAVSHYLFSKPAALIRGE